MSGFLYFVEGHKTLGSLEGLGLGYAFERSPACVECMAGPSGAGGIVIGADAASLGYFPDRQTWAPMADHFGIVRWVGYDTLPAARELERSEPVDGYVLELPHGDGSQQEWIIAKGRIFPRGTLLPQSLGLSPDGTLTRKVLPTYAAAAACGERIWATIRKANGLLEEGEAIEDLSDEEGFAAAATVLGVNYRVGPAEVSLLGVVTTANLLAILACYVDYPAYQAWRRMHQESKKNETGSTPGPEGSLSSTSAGT